jgi:hypothetical protein
MVTALFDISGDGEDRGFEATNGQTITLKLRQQPPIGVTSVLFQVWSDTLDESLGIAQNPPRASKGAPLLELVGSTTGAAVSPATVGGEVSCELPADGAHSFIVRCVVNGGVSTLPNGKSVLDTSLIHERGVFIPTASGARKVVLTETLQFEIDGWAGALADIADLLEGGGGGGGEATPGAQPPITLSYDFSTTPTAPPGGGSVRANDADVSLATQLFVSKLDYGETDWSAFYDSLAAGFVRLESVDGTKWIVFEFTSVFTESNYYRLVGTATQWSATAPFDFAEMLRLTFDVTRAQRAAVPSISGDTEQEQLDSIVEALVALGLAIDDRIPVP